jgi:peptidyl-prolyl cis-trans isomerase B (cyclophilin B)
MPKRHLIGCAVLAAATIGLTACGSSSSGGNSGQTTSPTATTGQSANGCSTPPALQTQHKQFSHEPPLTIAHTTYTGRVVTNCGTIVIALDGKNAPHTVNSFAFLSSQGYFTNTPCHRLTTSGIYVLQCGDPTGTGTGGPGYTIPDENLKGAKYPAGTVAMANTGRPHTGGSQFFFVYANTNLPPQYTPFGHVTSGLDVLTRIAHAGTNNAFGQGDGAPNQPVVIQTFDVTKGAPS